MESTKLLGPQAEDVRLVNACPLPEAVLGKYPGETLDLYRTLYGIRANCTIQFFQLPQAGLDMGQQ